MTTNKRGIKIMKKTIIILIVAIVEVPLLWLADEKLIVQISEPKPPEHQQNAVVVQRGSPTKKKAKPTSRPSVFDLTKKAHWYDPETTIGFQGASKTLSEWPEPFQPKPQEFQIIAQYETSSRKLKKSLSEDEYYSVEGRKQLMDKILKLTKRLREQLGEEHYGFHLEFIEPWTIYYHTWQVLAVNSISEDHISEFRELADEF